MAAVKLSRLLGAYLQPAKSPKPKRDRSHDAARRKAKALAAEHGIEIEVERYDGHTTLMVWGPRTRSADFVDPFAGDHSADNWTQALAMVEAYVKQGAGRK